MTLPKRFQEIEERLKAPKDLVDEFRAWELRHNRENYGRYDAFAAGYKLANSRQDQAFLLEAVKELWVALELARKELSYTGKPHFILEAMERVRNLGEK